MNIASPSSQSWMDLAVEASDLVRGARQTEIPGVTETISQIGEITRHDIRIHTEKGSQLLQRPIGSYITLQTPPLGFYHPETTADAIQSIAEILPSLIAEKTTLEPDDCVLVVGLGNRHAAADSLGPRFIEAFPVTRHYAVYAPDTLSDSLLRPCCSLAPGVLGTTGLETLDIVQGAVRAAHPALVITVDALSAQRVERIGCTIQLSNTGIQPGSGFSVHRKPFNQDTLGIPVISIGCPTIVRAEVIAQQAIETYTGRLQQTPDSTALQNTLEEIFSFYNTQFAVTPKEIEDITAHAAHIIACGVAKTLFPDTPEDELAFYIPSR